MLPISQDDDSFVAHRLPVRLVIGFVALSVFCSTAINGLLLLRGDHSLTGFTVDIAIALLSIGISAVWIYFQVNRSVQQITRSRDLLKAVTDAIPDLIFVKDREGKYVLANRAVGESAGLPVSDVIGKRDSELMSQSTARSIVNRDQGVMEKRKSITLEQAIRIEGKLRTHLTTIVPYLKDGDDPSGVIGIARDVTAQREADRTQRLAQFSVDRAVDAVFWIKPSGEIIYVNEAASRILGYTRSELIGKTVPEIDPNFPADAWPAHWAELKERGSFAFESDHVTKGGGSIRTEVTVNYLVHEGQEFNCAVMRDVTQRRNEENERRASDERYRSLVAALSEGIVFQSSTSEILAWNASAERLLGLSGDQLRGRTSYDPIWGAVRIDGTDLPGDEHPAMVALRTGQPCTDVIMGIRRPDSSRIWISVNSQPIFNEGSRSPNAVVSSFTDVTARLAAERARQESEARLQCVVERVPDPIYVSDSAGRIVHVNHAATRALGYGINELIGLNVLDVDIAFTKSSADELWKSMLDQPETIATFETNHRRKDGSSFPVEVRLSLIDWDGQPHYLATARDLTERRRSEDALRESESRFRSFMDNTPALAWINEENGSSSFVNAAWVRAYGRSHAAMKGSALRDVLTGQPVDTYLASDRAVIESNSAVQVFEPGPRSDGSPGIYHVHKFPLGSSEHGRRVIGGVAIDVTEQRRAEQALRESENRFRTLADFARIVVWEATPDGSRMTYVSEYAATLLGYSIEEWLTPGFWAEHVYGPDREQAISLCSTATAAMQDHRLEYRMVRSDGAIVWVDDVVQVLVSDGKVTGLRGVFIDSTARRLVEGALRESEDRYRRLIDVLPTAVFVQRAGSIVFCNPAFVSLIGARDESEIIGRSPFDVFHADYHDTIRKRITYMQEMGEPVSGIEEVLVRLDGRQVNAHVVATPVSDCGRPAVLVAIRDLTDRERSMSVLRSVLASVHDTIITIDVNGTILTANPAVERMFGYPADSLPGKNVTILMPAPHRSGHNGYISNFLRTGVAKVIGIGRELEGKRLNGELFPIELTVSEFQSEGQRQFTGVIRDITARKQLEEQLRQSQKMEAIGRLAGGVAHDFNNLLTVINGHSELVAVTLDPNDPNLASVTAVRDAGERAARLTSQLLAFSRKAIVEPKVLDLNDVVGQMGVLLRRLIGEDIRLILDLRPNPVRVRIDPGQLEQVLLNLVVNARDAMPTGGTLTLGASEILLPEDDDPKDPDCPPGRYARLVVTDTGCGMSAEVMSRVFEPFFTTKAVGKGTGLGLATVFGIVKQANGTTRVSSTLGQGSQFRVYLPLVDVTTAPDGDARTALRGGHETVLIVEDEDQVRQLARIALEMHGYVVLEAADVEPAITLAKSRSSPIHMLVTDVVMPGGSGGRVAEVVRAHHPNVKILYMSGYTDDAVVRHGVESDREAFLQKPFTPFKLARKVRDVLDQS